jgi:hypothetical protein
MTPLVLDGHLGATLTVDLCLTCHVFWFDTRESLMLSPGSTLKLFRLIGEQTATGGGPRDPFARCPRCSLRLLPIRDMQRSTTFQYLRCPREHGRLTTFFDFLREKNFIRPLSGQQIDELRRNLTAVNCSNCGGPIDLAKTSSCAHCGSPLSMLDMKQAHDLVLQLQRADRPDRPIDPALPLQLEQARRDVETSFAAFEQDSTWFSTVSSAGLVGAGLRTLLKLV